MMGRFPGYMNMKNIMLPGIFMFAVLLQQWGCQQEVNEIIQTPDSLVIVSNSTLAEIIRRATQKNGSYDSIIDHSSCVSLKPPFTVIINGQEMTVETELDIDAVEQILEDTEGEDRLEIDFPVTIILPDYSELTVGSEDELEDLVEDCESEGHDGIECVDFEYPLSISVYDSDNQLSDVITIYSDKELYDFMENLEEGDLAGFNFPITLALSSGEEIIIHGNEELEENFEIHEDDCFEPGEDGEDEVDSVFIAILTSGKWHVGYFFHETDKTEAFAGYEFTFHADRTALAENGLTTRNGQWQFYDEDGIEGIDLNFGEESPFGQIQEDWDIVEYDSAMLKLKHNEEADSASILHFTKI
ncbi:MAG TPA: hypothetical protein VI583_16710 [Cyclobacteriaceae bacterium]|nr:hypothetical protein [Cyclobacteriaceae bacterium]